MNHGFSSSMEPISSFVQIAVYNSLLYAEQAAIIFIDMQ